jgi:thiol-disulfide isomerase/thioredoxin
VRHVLAPDAPERLIPDTTFPTRPVRIIWFQGRPARPLPDGGAVALDGAGGVIEFGPHLAQRRPPALGGREIVSAASTRDALWLSDADGAVVRVAPDGRVQTVAQQEIQYPAVTADPTRDEVWLVRRPDYWEYRLPERQAPLLVRLAGAGSVAETAGHIIVPQEQLLTEFVNAGHVAVAGDTIYLAPFIRDQVIALSATGDTLWVTRRELPQSTPQPRFVLSGGKAMIDYHPVNLGVVLGPDDRLYVLSTPGFTTTEARLDVFDRFSGRLQRSARLADALPTLAADQEGRVYRIDPFRLFTGTDPAAREPFTAFDLELLGGGRMTLGDLAGKVTLINFWASWCTPCRTEMPALDSLRRSIADPEFQFLTMNEDVNRWDGAGFMRELGFDFPVLLGGGRLRERYHYIGLPFTVLLDREARVVQRWVGFAGAAQAQAERALIRAELDRQPSMAGMNMSGHPRESAGEQARHRH